MPAWVQVIAAAFCVVCLLVGALWVWDRFSDEGDFPWD